MVKQGQVYKLLNGSTKVEIIGVKQGVVTYCRVDGTGVIHTKSEELFLNVYVNSVEDSARKQFDKELKDLLDGNEEH